MGSLARPKATHRRSTFGTDGPTETFGRIRKNATAFLTPGCGEKATKRAPLGRRVVSPMTFARLNRHREEIWRILAPAPPPGAGGWRGPSGCVEGVASGAVFLAGPLRRAGQRVTVVSRPMWDSFSGFRTM
ncbi:hypothetical protein Acsp04_66480 [Actinomadura sp. NBRC 104425]|nr:hypothetical protein Acsp04_66480 [Actinomadura sp. NBRC 104425]